MGQGNSSNVSDVDFSNYEVIQSCFTQDQGVIKILQRKLGTQKYMLIEVNASSQEDHEKNACRFAYRKDIKHQNIIELIHIQSSVVTQFCSTAMKTYLLYDFIPDSFETLLVEKRN